MPHQTGPSDIRCPFIAHTRKTAPRNLDPYVNKTLLESSLVVRAGMPYGKEVGSVVSYVIIALTSHTDNSMRMPPLIQTEVLRLFAIALASRTDSSVKPPSLRTIITFQLQALLLLIMVCQSVLRLVF